MKPSLLSLLATFLLGSHGLHAEAPRELPVDLVAHEWGTFTAVVGSDGVEIPWWTPALEGPAALPEFVKPPVIAISGKAGLGRNPALIRMETPVIYFYAKRPTPVTVTVDTTRVRLTEVYPTTQFMPVSTALTKSQWQVGILPPHDTKGQLMPAVGSRGAHYAHAREVPEAWWVVGPERSGKAEVEKFIFYRGVGNITMPKRIHAVSDTGTRLIPGKGPLYLVEVDETGLRWKRIEPTSEENAGLVEITRASRNNKDSNDEVGLAGELIHQLTTSGLSRAESTAMVNTWHEAWLGETGLRLLEILPRQWVDEILPLTISPSPTRLERVFVARWELLTPGTEQSLLDLLESTGSPESREQALAALDLRRFGAAAFERVARIRDKRFRSDNQGLVISALNPPPVATTVPSP